MQNFTITPLDIIRSVLMAIGVLLFLIFGSWSLSHLDDQSMARGASNPKTDVNLTAVLPR